MSAICIYFKVHQPYQLKSYDSLDIGVNHLYEDAASDRAIIHDLADRCYLPTNELLLSLIRIMDDKFKVSFSFSGVILELLGRYRPDVIDSFRKLIATGCVDVLGETYYHSLSYLHSKEEFNRQVRLHSELIQKLFGVIPQVFRNTELIYDNALAQQAFRLGFTGVLCEGAGSILRGRSPNELYQSPGKERMPLLLRNSHLSDDIAFRFDDPYWSEYPLTAEKFAEWIHSHPSGTRVINLFLGYETFGIYKGKDTGIFDFLRALPEKVLARADHFFRLPTEVIRDIEITGEYDVPEMISWENQSAADSAWSRNVMQNNTLKKIYSLERMAMAAPLQEMQAIWGRLQAADYFFYMLDPATKDAFKYISPFPSPEAVFRWYTNMVFDLEIRLIEQTVAAGKKRLTRKGWSILNNN